MVEKRKRALVAEKLQCRAEELQHKAMMLLQMAQVLKEEPKSKRVRTPTREYTEYEGIQQLKQKLRRIHAKLPLEPPQYVQTLRILLDCPGYAMPVEEFKQRVGYNMVQSYYMGACGRKWNTNGAMHLMEINEQNYIQVSTATWRSNGTSDTATCCRGYGPRDRTMGLRPQGGTRHRGGTHPRPRKRC